MLQLNRQMRQRHEEEGSDEGFTLIELLVVLLIIGILLAIAIPTFLSVTHTATNTAAQANLSTALTGADTYYTGNNQSYSGLLSAGSTVSNIAQVDTGLVYTSAAASTATGTVSITYSGAGGYAMFAAWSPGTKDCWLVVDLKQTYTGTLLGVVNPTAGTYFDVIKNDTTVSTKPCTPSVGMSSQTYNMQTGTYPAG